MPDYFARAPPNADDFPVNMAKGERLISTTQAKYDEQECEDIVQAIAKSEAILMHEFEEQLAEEARMNAQFTGELMDTIRETYDAAVDAMGELIDKVKLACDQSNQNGSNAAAKQVAATDVKKQANGSANQQDK